MGAFTVGIVLSFLGSVKLALVKNVKIGDDKVGGLFSALMFSCVIGALIAGPLVDSLGQVMVFGFTLCTVCILVIANAGSYGVVLLSCLLLGVGALCVSTVSSTLAPIKLFDGKNASAAAFVGPLATLCPRIIPLLYKEGPGEV